MRQNSSYPIFVDLRDRPVLVVGAGGVAVRKVRGLLACGARVTVVSREFPANFSDLASTSEDVRAADPALPAESGASRTPAGAVACHLGAFEQGMIAWADWRLIFAATNDPEVNRAVQEAARAAHILCCRCDEQEESDFGNGAVARVGAVMVAVSTQGGAPGLAVRIKDQAVAAIDPVLAALAGLMGEWRRRVKEEIADAAVRRGLLDRLSGAEMEACLRRDGEAAARELFGKWLAETAAKGGGGHG